jgi:hypothetical protein
MMECEGSHPYHQHTHHPVMQTAPLDAQWLV